MKKYLYKHKTDIVIFLLFSIFIVVTYIINLSYGHKIKDNFFSFLFEMITVIPPMFILIGLFDVWVSKEKIQKHIGKDSGVMGIIWVILLAMLQAGPLYGAFPVTYILWKKGCSIKNIFIYLGAFSTMKIPMLGFEIAFLGIKFTILRTLVSLPIFILIGYLMDFLLKKSNFEVKEQK